MKPMTFSEMENALRLAVKLCKEPLNKIAIEVGFTASGFSSFTTKRSHISIEKGDKLFEYFSKNYPDVLELAFTMTEKGLNL